MVADSRAAEQACQRERQRTCPGCHRALADSEFWLDSTRPTGRHVYCLDCARERARNRSARWYAANRERKAAYQREYRARQSSP